MTTKVIITCEPGAHNDLMIQPVHPRTKSPFGYPTRLSEGNTIGLYVWSGQALVIEEVPKLKNDDPEET